MCLLACVCGQSSRMFPAEPASYILDKKKLRHSKRPHLLHHPYNPLPLSFVFACFTSEGGEDDRGGDDEPPAPVPFFSPMSTPLKPKSG